MLDYSKLKEFADDNFKIWWKWREVLQKVKKTLWENTNCSLEKLQSDLGYKSVCCLEYYRQKLLCYLEFDECYSWTEYI